MMTSRQMDRAVNAALARIMPPMVQALRDDLVAVLREEIAARDEAPAEAAPRQEAPASASASPLTVGGGFRRRLTEAGLAHLHALAAAGKRAPEIAQEIGISRRAVDIKLAAAGDRKGSAHSRRAKAAEQVAKATALFEGGLGTAEIGRRLGLPKTTVQGWKARHGWARQAAEDAAKPELPVLCRKRKEGFSQPAEDAANPKLPEPTFIGLDHSTKPGITVEVPLARAVPVVPAEAKPAPRQPAVTLPPNWGRVAAPATPPRPKAETITTTPKEVRAWLAASLKASGLSLVQAQDRVGFMTHDQALAEANQRRARAGYPPFAYLGSRSAA